MFVKKIILLFIILFVFSMGLSVRIWKLNRYDLKNDIATIESFQGEFPALVKLFTHFAKDKGALYAYDILRKAELPPGVDIHLLGHAIGDILFLQLGASGIALCTQEFRNACSHTMVVGLFLRDGEKVLGTIAEVCRKAPGGSGAYTMCFHGLGHGVLSATGYDLPKTVELCKKTGTKEKQFRESAECVGGAIMEIITGGFHDRELWEKQSKKYLSTSDPLYPCTSDFITSDVKNMCYVYLTPHLLLRAGGSLGNPTEEAWEEAMKYCEKLSDTDSNKATCFGGFGKEYILIGLSKDIRKINDMNEDQLDVIRRLCAKAPTFFGEKSCILSALNSLFWGGENDRSVSEKFCGMQSNPQILRDCFKSLTDIVFYYISDSVYIEKYCAEIPSEFRRECEVRGRGK